MQLLTSTDKYQSFILSDETFKHCSSLGYARRFEDGIFGDNNNYKELIIRLNGIDPLQKPENPDDRLTYAVMLRLNDASGKTLIVEDVLLGSQSACVKSIDALVTDAIAAAYDYALENNYNNVRHYTSHQYMTYYGLYENVAEDYLYHKNSNNTFSIYTRDPLTNSLFMREADVEASRLPLFVGLVNAELMMNGSGELSHHLSFNENGWRVLKNTPEAAHQHRKDLMDHYLRLFPVAFVKNSLRLYKPKKQTAHSVRQAEYA